MYSAGNITWTAGVHVRCTFHIGGNNYLMITILIARKLTPLRGESAGKLESRN